MWRNAKMNFDNTWNSLLTLYEVAGLEMWLDVMYSAMDGVSCCSYFNEAGNARYSPIMAISVRLID